MTGTAAPARDLPASSRRSPALVGTGILARRFLRRDRWMLLWWSVAITVLYVNPAGAPLSRAVDPPEA